MSFLYRINLPKQKWQTLTRQFTRCYLQIPHAHSLNNTPHKAIRGFENPFWVDHGKPADSCYNLRFFSIRAKAMPSSNTKQDPKKDETSGPRLNGQIRAEFVRLVTDEGHEIVPKRAALERARKLNLDLVEVQRTADPPVCKIMDFHREKYNKQIKEKDRAKSKSELTLRAGGCKEVRFSCKIAAKDLKMKADTVKRLMDRGYRVKCMAVGTEEENLAELLSQLSSLIEDVAIVESGPYVEKRQAYVLVRHIKFGPSKKGSGKKASKVVGTTSSEDATMSPTNSPTTNPTRQIGSPVGLKEESDPAETDVDSEVEVLSDEADTPISPTMRMPGKTPDENKITWSVFDANDDDLDKVFNFPHGANSTEKQTNAKLQTASSLENNRSHFPRPIPDSIRRNLAPSTPAEPPLDTLNRYRKSEPNNRFIPNTSKDSRGQVATNPPRSVQQSPNQEKQSPSHMNSSPSTGETKLDRTDALMFRNMKLPVNEIPKHDQSRPSSQPPSYGGFSAPKAEAPGRLDPFANSPHPGPPSSQQSSYGAFSASKAEAPRRVDPSANTAHPGPPCSQRSSYGAFSSPKAEGPRKLDPFVKSSRSEEPWLPNQGKQSLSDPHVLHSRGGIKQVPADAPVSKPSTNDGPKPEQSRPVPPSSPTPSYGIFSASTATDPGKQGMTSEVNRKKEGNVFESVRNPGVGQKAGTDQNGRGGWGIFSRVDSKAIPSRTSDNEAKGQR